MRLHKQAAAVALACLVVFIACYSAVGMQNDVLAAGGATGASRTSTALAIAGAALLAVSPPADLAEEPFGGAVEQRQRDASDGGDSDDGDYPGGVTGHGHLSASDFKRTPSTHLFLAHSTMCQFKSSIQASLCRHGAKKDT